MSHGPTAILPGRARTLVELARVRAERHPDRPLYTFLQDGGGEERMSFAELDQRARRVAAALLERTAPGERALLLFPPGLDYVAAFFGCLYAGVVAVPAYPPRLHRAARGIDRLLAIAGDARPAVALTTATLLEPVQTALSASTSLRGVQWLAGEASAPSPADGWNGAPVDPETVAFLQYTSGSTGTPKGVMVTHANLMHNQALMRDAFRHAEGDTRIVGWLPMFHDMGLVGNILHPVYLGAPCVLMSPVAFTQRPLRWLRAVSEHRATTSGGPNFAFDLCVRKTTPEERASLDLSSWRIAFNGAEPVRAATLDRFAEAFAPAGFRREAFYPCYGMAEATLMVTGGLPDGLPVVERFAPDALTEDRAELAGDGAIDARVLVGSGGALAGQTVLVVDPEGGVALPEGRVGEVWVSGPSVAAGYWERPELTREAFGARLADGRGPFLRTGDLGFQRGGELFVTGRAKDLMIVRGRNHYPQDVETSAEGSHPALRPGGAAAFSVELEGEERVVTVVEVERRARRTSVEEIAAAVRRAVAEEHGLPIHAVVLVSPGAVPRTSSGKLRRSACRDAFLGEALEEVGRSVVGGAGSAAMDWTLERDALLATPDPERSVLLREHVRAVVAHALGTAPERVDDAVPLPALGLDSVAAAEIATGVEHAFGAAVDPVDLLAGATLARLTAEVGAAVERGAGAPRRAPAVEEGGWHPASPGQRALWFLHRLAPESTAYHVARALRLRGELDTAALRTAWNALSVRHDMLRAVFSDAEGEVRWRVSTEASPGWCEVDADGWDEATLRAHLEEEARRPFDPGVGPLLRLALLRRGPEEHVLLLVVHHLVADLWSLGVLLRELSPLYAAACAGREAPPPPPALRYVDWVSGQLARAAAPEGLADAAFWEARLRDVPPLELPTDRPRPAVARFRGATHPFRLDEDTTARLAELCRTRGATPFMGLLAAFQSFLHRYTGQGDFAVGVPHAGRTGPGTHGLVGYLVNPLPLRARVEGSESFAVLLDRVREETLAAFRHAEHPFARTVEALRPERDPGRAPLFQVMLAVQSAFAGVREVAGLAVEGAGGEMEVAGTTATPLAVDAGGAQFDLSLHAAEGESGEWAMQWEYDAELFDASTVQAMSGHFATLVASAVADPGCAVERLALLAGEERRRVVQEWNRTTVPRPSGIRLEGLVRARVERTPDAPALSWDGGSASSAGVHRRAERLARRLRDAGVGPDVVVGICAERSPEMVVGLLAVLEAGGAWLPLDPTHPPERLAGMLRDAGARAVLVQPSLAAALPAGLPLVALEWEGDDGAAVHDADPLPASGSDRSLAYVIYTSGSTGRPKGVMIDHRGIVNRILWMQEALGLGPDDVVLQKTPFTFDVSVWEFFWPLAAGARLAVARPGDHRDPDRLVETILREGVTTLHFVPSMLRAFLEADGVERCRCLRRVVCSGEALPPELARRCMARLPWARLYNLYGPTEASVDVTAWACTREDGRATVPIGRPIANTRVHVLDASLEPLPPRVPGELYVGGVGVARGYAGRPALTAELFVPDPLGGEPGGRLYRTGDRARWTADGVLEFLGRTDLQVKVRGVRIEPAEVEATLLGHPGISAAAVDARGPAAATRLVAWVAGRGAPPPSAAELRRFLGERLPEGMIPSVFVPVDALPLTSSGKLDRRALPGPVAAPPEADAFTPPGTPEEEALAEVWAEILDVPAVSATANFFDLGGDSLLSIQVMSQARARGLHFELADLFRHPTVRDLARGLRPEASGVFAAEPVPPFGLVAPEDRERLPADAEDAYPLSVIQHGLVFHAEYNPDYEVYVTTLRLRGRWSEEAMRGALDHVAARHPMLRTSYDLHRYSVPLQVVHRGARIPLEVADLRAAPPGEREQALRDFLSREKKRPLDWQRPPLMRIHVHRLDDSTFQLTRSDPMLDGWSTARFLTELVRAYHALLGGEALPPPEPLAATFRDFVALEQRVLASEEMHAFWRRELEGCTVCALPRGAEGLAPRGEAFVDRVWLPVPDEVSAGLRALARAAGVPLKSVLLAAHLRALAHLSGTDDVVSGVIANGRLEQPDGEAVLGGHLNVMPFRMRLERGTWKALVRQAFEAERAYLPFRRYPMAEVQRRNGRQPLFEAVFNYTHFRPYQSLSGLPGVEVVDGTASDQTYFPLTAQLNVDHATGGVRLAFDFNTGDLARAQVEGFAALYLRVFGAMAGDPGGAHDACVLLPEAEIRSVVEWPNATHHPADGAGTLVARVAGRAAESPDACAIAAPSGALTRGELHARAGLLARRLQALGVGTGGRVALLAPRSPELVLGALAALRAGAAYVPLDPVHPAERLAYMLADSGAAALLATRETAERVPDLPVPVLRVEMDASGEEEGAAVPPLPDPHPESLAYVIYTSGSTGRPKGVAVPHRGLLNLVEWHCRTYGLSASDRTALVAGPGFDASVWELWPSLACGAALLIPPDPVRFSPEALRDWLLAERVTVTFLPTPLAEAVAELPWPADTPLRALLTGGDRLHRHPRRRLPFRLVNHYGPTENSVVATAGEVESGVEEARLPTIGRPIHNVRVYLLDPWTNPVPPGVPGELYVAGEGLACGYVGRPGLTAACFVPDPFDRRGGGRLYRTGDRARWSASGEVEFLGRIDQQVKIRGHRIEPGEIETVLAEHPAVREAAVVVRAGSGGEGRLTAYFVPREGTPADADELRARLAGYLPEYMVPTTFVPLPALPVTPSGKVDRSALPDPGDLPAARRPYLAPRTPVEAEVAAVWAAVLGAEQVGMSDNFFELGGHSLLATQVVSRLRATLAMEIPLPLLFESPVAGDFAARLDALRGRAEEEEMLGLLALVSGLTDAEVAARLHDGAPADPV